LNDRQIAYCKTPSKIHEEDKMAKIKLKGNEIETIGSLPAVDSAAPDFTLVKSDLSQVSLKDYRGKNVVLNIFPSIDTGVCAASVRRFNSEAGSHADSVVLCISADLPFAHSRFCEAEGLKNVVPASSFRAADFGKNYGQTITTGPLAGLLARSVVVINPQGKVKYTEQVPEITQEPNYAAALKALAA
jgi:thiol peroxidase